MQRETVELLVAVACAASSYLVGAFILFFFRVLVGVVAKSNFDNNTFGEKQGPQNS